SGRPWKRWRGRTGYFPRSTRRPLWRKRWQSPGAKPGQGKRYCFHRLAPVMICSAILKNGDGALRNWSLVYNREKSEDGRGASCGLFYILRLAGRWLFVSGILWKPRGSWFAYALLACGPMIIVPNMKF